MPGRSGWLAATCAAGALLLAGCGGDSSTALVDAGTDVPVERGPDMATSERFAPPVDDPTAISSTFGPRWKYSASRYDYHRGIDYYGELGDPLYAIGTGEVVALYPDGSAQFPNGGNTLIVRHDLVQPFTWQDTQIDRIYAVYLHMDSFAVSEGDQVESGEVVGGMGATGDTVFVHLHFEIRVQTVCSLEYQIANPGAACAQWGFDPHVHPFAFLGGANTDAVTVRTQAGTPFVVTFEAGRGDLDLNGIRAGGHALNFNRRTGIDATTTAALDDLDYGWVNLVPDEVLSTSDTIRYVLEFPQKPRDVEFTDLWGRGVHRALK